jgi:hypothetical protein
MTNRGSTAKSFSLITSESRVGGGWFLARRPKKPDTPNIFRLVESPPIDGGLELVIRSRNLNDLILVPPREANRGAGGSRTSAMGGLSEEKETHRQFLPTVGKSQGVKDK